MAEHPALPDRMRAALVAAPGPAEAIGIGEIETPRPGVGEVLIRVRAAGVNRPDVLQRQGAYPPPDDASPRLGLEVAGEVVALGPGVAAPAVGASVAALVEGGGYAEFCTAPAAQCLPWPAGYDAIRAAALPENLFTVWASLLAPLERAGAGLRTGQSVLVHGGASGIGLAAIGLARHLRGAAVFATAGGPARCEAVRAAGATDAFDHRGSDFRASTLAATGGRGVDVVLDVVGGPYLGRNLRCLARDGRLVSLGLLGGRIAEAFDMAPIMGKRLHLLGSTMRGRTRDERAEVARAVLAEVWPLLEDGRFAPTIAATFPLEDAAGAHRLMESGAHVGKIVLTVGGAA